MNTAPRSTLLHRLLRLPLRLLRVLLMLLAGAAALAALLVGAVLGLGVLLWARLRGRPVLRVQRFAWRRGAARSGPGGGDAVDVVDVQARELHDAPAGTVERLR